MLSELYDQVETYIPSLNSVGDVFSKIEKVTQLKDIINEKCGL